MFSPVGYAGLGTYFSLASGVRIRFMIDWFLKVLLPFLLRFFLNQPSFRFPIAIPKLYPNRIFPSFRALNSHFLRTPLGMYYLKPDKKY